MEAIATLHNAVVSGYKGPDDRVSHIAYGLISDDKSNHGNHPFPDGTQVSTSYITSIDEVDGETYITTNNTIYKVSGKVIYNGIPYEKSVD